jgi:predicted metal-dependent peptidase
MAKVFLGSNSAFLGSIMCTLTFVWTEEVKTAGTDGLTLWWNPHWFMSLLPEARVTILKHELWHPGRLHMIRRGTRDPEIWNWACDIRINNDLKREGESFKGIESGWIMPEVDANGIMVEEDIYNLLEAKGLKPPTGLGGGVPGQPGDGDMGDNPSDATKQAVVSNVVRAVQQATMAGGAGQIPGITKTTLDKFLESIVPWETLLMKFMTDLVDDDEYTWRRPNRRYSDMYMPSQEPGEGRLEHLAYFIDVSGSVSDADVVRCNSEIKYIKDVLNPKTLTLCLFDTKIQETFVFEEDEPFEKLVITGRGGTSFECVRREIDKLKPTAAVIFSDMDCPPMHPLETPTPVIWIGVNARNRSVPFGTIIHIKS